MATTTEEPRLDQVSPQDQKEEVIQEDSLVARPYPQHTTAQDDESDQLGQLKKQETMLSNQIKQEGACGKNCGWITCCIAAGLCMGTGAFIYASNYSEHGLVGSAVLGPGPFVVFSMIKLIREIVYRCRKKTWVRPEDSAWVSKEGGIRWSSIIPLAVNVSNNVAYVLIMTIAWRFARQAGLNQGVITQLLFFASIINCVTFYCFFGEKISKLHLIGVGLMCCGIVCIGAAAATTSEEDIDEDIDTGGRSPLVNGIIALSIGFGGPCVISSQQLVVRKFSGVYKGLDQGIDSVPLRSIFFMSLLPSLSEQMTIEWSDIAIGGIAGTLIEISRVLISIGIALGKAGPAQALMSTHALWQAIWSAAFVGQTLTGFQIAGISLGLLGVSSISYFDHLAKKHSQKSQLAQVRRQIETELGAKNEL